MSADGWEYFRHDHDASTDHYLLDFWSRVRPERRGIFRRRDVWVWEVHNQLTRDVHPDRCGEAVDRADALAAIDETLRAARSREPMPPWWNAPSGDTKGHG